ncbi:MAG: DEAD/DEAH box helicase, partial [Acidimicrobiia bacterium]|nr:DEAD/DEAH box helicase [Acidimicrobiia bacterium]
DRLAAGNLASYLAEEQEAAGVLPTDQTIVIQRFRDEIGDWRVVLLSPLGARVLAPWAMAVTQRLGEHIDADVIWSDDGIAFRFPDADQVPDASDLIPEPEEIESLLVDRLAGTAMFAARFREAAGRSLLLPRRRPGNRTPLWLQRRKAADLLSVAKRFGNFPIVLETYREILQDDFDLPGLTEVLVSVQQRRIRVAEIEVPSPSPFASNLLFAFVAAYLYEGDAPLAERRATTLSLDRELLAELLGEGELRDLLDEDALVDLELELQGLARKVSGPDAIHDLLRRIGPLSSEELAARVESTALEEVLADLAKSRRIAEVRVASRRVWSAVEDAARLRDALGVQPAPAMPSVFLEPVEDPLGDVVGRFARTHGPFSVADAANRLGLPNAVLQEALTRLETEGRVVKGAFRPRGAGQEWIDAEVLRRLKTRSLAALRKEIEPVDHSALGRFLPRWQGVGSSRTGAGAGDLIRMLQGVPIPASCLERDVLASRIGEPATIVDRMMIEGDLVWVGRGSLGAADGKLSLFMRSQLALFRPAAPPDGADGAHHRSILDHLEQRGASFFADLYEACGGGDPAECLEALWDLVWAGEVTNDTLAPVRAFLRRGKGKVRARRSMSSAFPPHAAGRWSLVPTHIEDDTRRAAALADLLLDRHGVVVRNSVASEEVPGGFSSLYPVFSSLEEIGRIRRGYFVEGLGGSQFAVPAAVDRLRRSEGAGVVTLAATDPANPYGGALDWPAVEGFRI